MQLAASHVDDRAPDEGRRALPVDIRGLDPGLEHDHLDLGQPVDRPRQDAKQLTDLR
jgi:hypothetical protein